MKILLTAWLVFGGILFGASLEFEKPLIELDAAIDAKLVTTEFKFTNPGKEKLTIREADAGCSCLSVEVAGGKMAYAPGESGVFRATFEVGSFQGAVDKQINIWLDGDPEDKPSTTVTMRVNVPVIIRLEPKTLKWQVGSEAKTMTMDVFMDYKKAIHVKDVTTSNGDFETVLKTVKDGKHYQVQVTPKSTKSPGLVIVRIVTDVDVEKQKIQQGFAVVSAGPPKP